LRAGEVSVPSTTSDRSGLPSLASGVRTIAPNFGTTGGPPASSLPAVEPVARRCDALADEREDRPALDLQARTAPSTTRALGR
jgi:hypothetical protein